VNADKADDSAPAPTPIRQADALRSLRKKLARRAAAAAAGPAHSASPPDAIVYRRDLPRATPPPRPAHAGPGICIPLERLVEGTEAISPMGRAFYLVEAPVAPHLAPVLPRALDALSPDFEAALAPDDVCFLDIETTGLGTALTFLIGTLVWHGGQLVCRQLLARTYAEEAAIIHAFAQQARRTPLFVTFNGKTFDVPSLRARAAATGAALAEPRFHFDLLHVARRRFGHALPDCRLQTLERVICRRHRVGDIAGADIGRAYHDFVRTGDAREMARIVEHNRRDLVTVAELMARILLTRDA